VPEPTKLCRVCDAAKNAETCPKCELAIRFGEAVGEYWAQRRQELFLAELRKAFGDASV
jgi:hypothetical protein